MPEPHWAGREQTAAGGGGSSTTGLEVTAPLSQAQLRTMFSAPVVCVPGVAGRVILAQQAIFTFNADASCPQLLPNFGWGWQGISGSVIEQSCVIGPGAVLTIVQLAGVISATDAALAGKAIVIRWRDADLPTLAGTGQAVLRYTLL